MEGAAPHGVTFVTLYARIVYELAQNPRIAQEVLARKLDVTIRTMQRHMTELERSGFIAVRRDHKPFTYQVQWDRPVPHFEEMTLAMFRPRQDPKVEKERVATRTASLRSRSE